MGEDESEDFEKVHRVISEAPIFSGLGAEKIREILRLAEKRTFHQAEFIVHEGDLATSFYLVLDGQVEVKRGGRTLGRIGRSQFFGETTLAQDETRIADIIAAKPTTCLILTRARLRKLIEENPQIAVKMIEEIVRRNRSSSRFADSEVTSPQASSPNKSPEVAESDVTFTFANSGAQRVFETLVDCFIRDYMVKKFVAEKSGWRTSSEIARESGIAISQLYDKQGGGGVGSGLEEPIRRGVVERRYFPGERGRGGEVARFRIAYDKEPLKSFVHKAITQGRMQSNSRDVNKLDTG